MTISLMHRLTEQVVVLADECVDIFLSEMHDAQDWLYSDDQSDDQSESTRAVSHVDAPDPEPEPAQSTAFAAEEASAVTEIDQHQTQG